MLMYFYINTYKDIHTYTYTHTYTHTYIHVHHTMFFEYRYQYTIVQIFNVKPFLRNFLNIYIIVQFEKKKKQR